MTRAVALLFFILGRLPSNPGLRVKNVLQDYSGATLSDSCKVPLKHLINVFYIDRLSGLGLNAFYETSIGTASIKSASIRTTSHSLTLSPYLLWYLTKHLTLY